MVIDDLYNGNIRWQRDQPWRIAVIGECMIELREHDGLRQSFAGDSMNTATYLRRELIGEEHQVDYVTVVGCDPFSIQMQNFLKVNGLGVDLIAELPGKSPGLYWIKTDVVGERSFHYWRSDSAARQLMKHWSEEALTNRLSDHQLVYLSGISIAILPEQDRRSLLNVVSELRELGCVFAFDSNYRAALWESPDAAREWISKAVEISDLALVSFGDEQALFGDSTPAKVLERISGDGVSEVVVKNGGAECFVCAGGETRVVESVKSVEQIDTTAAGDSFNAAYIAARIAGHSEFGAVAKGHELAAKVVQYPGAIVPT